MNALIQFLIDLLRRAAPTPATFRRAWASAMARKFATGWMIGVFTIMAIYFSFLVSMQLGYYKAGRYVAGASYLIVLPDRYPDAEYTLSHRRPAVYSYVEETLRQLVEALRKQHSAEFVFPHTSTGEKGLFSLGIEDPARIIPSGKSRVELEKHEAEILKQLDLAAAQVAAKMPEGTRVERIGKQFGTESPKRYPPVLLIYLAGIGVALVLACVVIGVVNSRVVDLEVAAALFPATTKFLQVPKYPNLESSLASGEIPAEIRLLAQYLSNAYDQGKRTVAITSASDRSGKTTLLLALAYALSRSRSVILVDADATQRATRMFTEFRKRKEWASAQIRCHALRHEASGVSREATAEVPLPSADHWRLIDCSPLFAVDGAMALVKSADVSIMLVEELQFKAHLEAAVADLNFFEVSPTLVVINRARRASTRYGYFYGHPQV